jgi:hypothetical protein
VPFVVTFDGEEFDTDELTLDEAIAVEKATGHSWHEINPFRSGEDCKAILVTVASRRVSREEAEKRVGAMTVAQVLGSIDVKRKDDLPEMFEDGIPLPAPASVTGGSSPAPDGSGGPPT